jgi:hypothetical protein
MKYSPFFLCVILLIASAVNNACSITKETQSTWKQSLCPTPVVSGWVPVVFGVESDYIATNRGRLSEIYDEFVGGLFDDGLSRGKTGWLKPTYGNRNLLWTLDSDIGNRRQQSLLKSIEEFPSETYEFANGVVNVSNSSWKYVGYMDKTNGTGSAAFLSFIFICRGSTTGASVFYWGDGMAIQPQANKSVKELLSEISSYCK